MVNTINDFVITSDSIILDALKKLDSISSNGKLTLFVVNKYKKVIGSLTDGDCRRALIKNANLKTPIIEIMNKDFTYINDQNYSVELINHIRKEGFKFVPYLNYDKTIKKIIDFSNGKSFIPIDAVLMAGGKGMRLRPLTENTPKPLLKVADKPIIDYNIENLLNNGVDNITVTVNYLAEQIESHFKDPVNGVTVNCIKEKKFLGTIGGITYIKKWYNDVILLMNSDLFTNFDIESFYLHFIEHNADMSVAAVPYNVNIPYGILELDGVRSIKGIKEKPSYYYYASAGIYLIRRSLIDLIPKDEFYDATDFLKMLIEKKYKVIRYPISGYWIDIGKPVDFQKVQEMAKHLKG